MVDSLFFHVECVLLFSFLGVGLCQCKLFASLVTKVLFVLSYFLLPPPSFFPVLPPCFYLSFR